MKNENLLVDVTADTTQFDAAMESLTDATRDFGRVFTSTISRSIQSGKGLDDTLRSLGRRFSDLALKQALKPAEDLFGNLLGSVIGSAGGVAGSGFGASTSLPVTPFAKGGVVSSPTAFGFGRKLGVMGEAGKEAIMPLARGPDGRLGVAAAGGADTPPNIVFNVTASDAGSFKKSEAQITAMLARAVARGQRSL